MQFYLAPGIVWQTNRGDSLNLPPATATIHLAQMRANLNTEPPRNDFYTPDRADDLKLHVAK